MAQQDHILAIDQGTTSSRAIVFDRDGRIAGLAQRELPQIFPRSGWVEHDVERIWADTVAVTRDALAAARVDAGRIAAIGITNQRETAVLWDRASGAPVHNAIVWQDRRTTELCEALRADGLEDVVSARTGLLIDPYFSATKLAWLLDTMPGARERAERGDLAFGTVDSYLLWRLTGGRVHATDATNASRTLLYDIHQGAWSDELLEIFRVPRQVLPAVLDNCTEFGIADADLLGRPIPITGVAGDQQAATVGQACFEPGMTKSTYGTGCFALINIGETAAASKHRLLTTIAYRLDGRTTYALEGSIFVAGAAVQWLRDRLGVLESAAASEALAQHADPEQEVILVPAFTGLGAPHWDSRARGALFGLTRATGPAELAHAALESVCYQTSDLVAAMAADSGQLPVSLRADGGMAANNWVMQFLADILGVPVERPVVTETTALGAAYLAGRHVALYPDLQGFAARWQAERTFVPAMDEAERTRRLARWQDAVRRVRTGD
jgi:glycerol kinase